MQEPIARRTMAAHAFTALEILEKGLLAVKFDQRQLDRVGLKKNLSRFRSNCVGHPRVCAILFEMLQETGSLDCSILGLEKSLNYFFINEILQHWLNIRIS